jgi:hypothetical protein
MDYILIFFFFIILLVLVIFGLPIGRTSFKDEIKDIQNEVVRENFESNAPSTFSEWRDMTNNKFIPDIVSSENETVPSDDVYGDASYLETSVAESSGDCSKCNAPRCKNIDKYVLKSSVPPCPDLNNYILKSEIPPFPDMNNYIPKNQIPSCPTCPNMNDYIPKNQIPVCPTCPDLNDYMLKSKIPVCEKCPTCPTCPKEYKNITENPKFKEWLAEYEKIVEDKINKNYIGKKECSKAVEKAYKNGEIDTYKDVLRRFRDANFVNFIEKKLGQAKSDVKEESRNESRVFQEERRNQNNRVFQEERREQNNRVFQEEISSSKNNNKKKSNQYQTSYNTTNMNEIYNRSNTNFDNTYDGKVKNNNYTNFADWNKSSLLLEEEYYKDIPNACNSF